MENLSWIDITLYISYGLIAIATLAAILLPLIKSMKDPRSLIAMGAGVAGLVVIFLIAYALSDNEVLPSYVREGVGPGESKFIGGTLITMYLLLGIALLSIAVTEVSKAIK